MVVQRWPVSQWLEFHERDCSLALVTADGALADWVQEQMEPRAWRWLQTGDWVAQVRPQDVVLGELDLVWAGVPQLRPAGVPVLALVEERVDLGIVLAQGVAGCIIRRGVRQQLLLALQMVLAGQVYLSRELLQHWLLGVRGEGLSPREQEVLLWLTQGEANDQIAQRLGITVATVKAHLTSIFSKLQVQNRTQAIVHAMRGGWGG